jgi:hypothetical protein
MIKRWPEIFILLFPESLPFLILVQSLSPKAYVLRSYGAGTPERRSPTRLLRLRVGRDARSPSNVRRRRHAPAYAVPAVAVHDVRQHLLQVL